jgi:hypothetical protein
MECGTWPSIGDSISCDRLPVIDEGWTYGIEFLEAIFRPVTFAPAEAAPS